MYRFNVLRAPGSKLLALTSKARVLQQHVSISRRLSATKDFPPGSEASYAPPHDHHRLLPQQPCLADANHGIWAPSSDLLIKLLITWLNDFHMGYPGSYRWSLHPFPFHRPALIVLVHHRLCEIKKEYYSYYGGGRIPKK